MSKRKRSAPSFYAQQDDVVYNLDDYDFDEYEFAAAAEAEVGEAEDGEYVPKKKRVRGPRNKKAAGEEEEAEREEAEYEEGKSQKRRSAGAARPRKKPSVTATQTATETTAPFNDASTAAASFASVAATSPVVESIAASRPRRSYQPSLAAVLAIVDAEEAKEIRAMEREDKRIGSVKESDVHVRRQEAAAQQQQQPRPQAHAASGSNVASTAPSLAPIVSAPQPLQSAPYQQHAQLLQLYGKHRSGGEVAARSVVTASPSAVGETAPAVKPDGLPHTVTLATDPVSVSPTIPGPTNAVPSLLSNNLAGSHSVPPSQPAASGDATIQQVKREMDVATMDETESKGNGEAVTTKSETIGNGGTFMLDSSVSPAQLIPAAAPIAPSAHVPNPWSTVADATTTIPASSSSACAPSPFEQPAAARSLVKSDEPIKYEPPCAEAPPRNALATIEEEEKETMEEEKKVEEEEKRKVDGASCDAPPALSHSPANNTTAAPPLPTPSSLLLPPSTTARAAKMKEHKAKQLAEERLKAERIAAERQKQREYKRRWGRQWREKKWEADRVQLEEAEKELRAKYQLEAIHYGMGHQYGLVLSMDGMYGKLEAMARAQARATKQREKKEMEAHETDTPASSSSFSSLPRPSSPPLLPRDPTSEYVQPDDPAFLAATEASAAEMERFYGDGHGYDDEYEEDDEDFVPDEEMTSSKRSRANKAKAVPKGNSSERAGRRRRRAEEAQQEERKGEEREEEEEEKAAADSKEQDEERRVERPARKRQKVQQTAPIVGEQQAVPTTVVIKLRRDGASTQYSVSAILCKAHPAPPRRRSTASLPAPPFHAAAATASAAPGGSFPSDTDRYLKLLLAMRAAHPGRSEMEYVAMANDKWLQLYQQPPITPAEVEEELTKRGVRGLAATAGAAAAKRTAAKHQPVAAAPALQPFASLPPYAAAAAAAAHQFVTSHMTHTASSFAPAASFSAAAASAASPFSSPPDYYTLLSALLAAAQPEQQPAPSFVSSAAVPPLSPSTRPAHAAPSVSAPPSTRSSSTTSSSSARRHRCGNRACDQRESAASAPFRVCARCRAVRYCSTQCQLADWKRRHRRHCATGPQATAHTATMHDE